MSADLSSSSPTWLPEVGQGLPGPQIQHQGPAIVATARVRCQKCGKGWTGHNIQHCTQCHESFSGSTSGDRHRIGDFAIKEGPKRRRCRTPDEMREIGMEQNRHGVWTNGGESPWAK